MKSENKNTNTNEVYIEAIYELLSGQVAYHTFSYDYRVNKDCGGMLFTGILATIRREARQLVCAKYYWKYKNDETIHYLY